MFPACDQPLVFMGKGGKGVHPGQQMNIRQAGTILSARGHMHVGLVNTDSSPFPADYFRMVVKP
jgi:hypothetical protein